MRPRFTQSYKIQAVEKALRRTEGTSIVEVAEALGIGYSTLQKWIVKSRDHEFDLAQEDEVTSLGTMTKEKRPQDWSMKERLTLVIDCGAMDGEEVNEHCRRHGLYPHHIKQWQQDFMSETRLNNTVTSRSELKALKRENSALKKELNRKDKALAETAALLVLQKKVNAIWGNDAEDSQ